MDREEILLLLKARFEELQKDLKFKASFKQLDEIFFIKDHYLERKTMPERFDRDLSHRIASTFNSWIGTLHNWVIPNPSSLIAITESNQFSDEEKEEMKKVMKDFMKILSLNSVIGLGKDKKLQAKYFDEAHEIWLKHKGFMLDKINKVHAYWES